METQLKDLEQLSYRKKDKNMEHFEDETDSGRASNSDDNSEDDILDTVDNDEPYNDKIVWQNIGKFIVLHGLALYGVTLLPSLSWMSLTWLLCSAWFAGLGITGGAHRLWAHKTYKAKLPLRILLTVANSMAGQNSILVWSRDHRVHHKCSETVGDPHNAKRGFFFAHMGWLLVRKHPAVSKAGKTISMSDLEEDSIVMFQHRHYIPLFILTAFVLPTIIPSYLWGETLTNGYFIAVMRYVLTLHFTWLVNSAAHLYGNKPYDVNIGPTENMVVSLCAMGEGFHNYHHTFPYDYSTSEWGLSHNMTTAFINFMARIGQAYKLRTANPATVTARALRTGIPALTRAGAQH